MTRRSTYRLGLPASVGSVLRAGVVGVLALAALATVGAGTARAGGYTITANGPQVCALGVFTANVPGFTADCDSSGGVHLTAPAGGSAYNDRQLWEIDSPSAALTITGAQFASIETDDINNAGSPGYGGGAYWNAGGQPLSTGGGDDELGFGSDPDSSTAPFSSQYFGLQIACTDTLGCDGQGTQAGAELLTNGFVSLAVQENQAPSLIAAGSSNLYYQTAGWVWNAPSDPWPASIYASDPSGVCSMAVDVNGTPSNQISAQPNTAVFQQCPSPSTDTAVVDTSTYVPTSGQLLLGLSATNAAGVASTATASVNVDNVQPSVGITAVNDPNPGGWAVDHSVTLQIAPSAGPSGISSVSCSDTLGRTTSRLKLTTDPTVPGDDDVTIDGNGSHTVACSVANNASNPQGAHNTGTSSETVDIDEQPPSLSFEPTDPTNPAQVVVQTADNESLVAGGSIEITAQGSSTPVMLPTTFTSNGQLIATIPDATLKAGPYTVQASATSQVGNTGTTSEGVSLPLRTVTTEAVSFARIADNFVFKRVRERVLVGWHYVAKLNKHGKPIKVKVGGHYKTIKILKRVEQCTTRRVKVAKHKWQLKTTCAKPHTKYEKTLTIGHGKQTKVYGELTTSQGVPVVNGTVDVITIPRNGGDSATTVATVRTNATGGWSAKIPAGPSRVVEGKYEGAEQLLPQTARVALSVPARITIRVSATRVRWNGVVTIRGQLKGGYIPRDGVAMRLLIRLPGRKTPYSPVPFRTTSTGGFTVKWSWGTGSGVATYPFSVATTAAESDYPFSASASRRVDVTFGR